MSITNRLAAVLAAGFALAAAPETGAWKRPRSASSPAPGVLTMGIPALMPDQPETGLQLPSVALTPRQLIVFASGFLLAAAALVGVWVALNADSSPVPGKSTAGSPALQSEVLASGQSDACSRQPATLVAGEKDGHFPLQDGVSGLIAADIATFMVIGKEAATAGRPRDAEVAFLMSCRVADKLRGASSVESANAKYQLGAHYARLALDAGFPVGADRAELLKRAELLYSESLHAYVAKYGEGDEQSRFATEGLAAVRQTLAQGDSRAVAEKSIQAFADGTTRLVGSGEGGSTPFGPSESGSQPLQVDLATAELPAPPVPQYPGATRRSRPSFDCTRARSVPDRIICSDAELSRLDRELGRVYRRASKLTPDRAAFQRQTNHEWRMRETTCRDRECLLRWYAHRRDQLMSVIEGRKQSLPTASRWGAFPDDSAGLYRGH
jgi:hypothetical protein